jgi:hypothetical protein
VIIDWTRLVVAVVDDLLLNRLTSKSDYTQAQSMRWVTTTP